MYVIDSNIYVGFVLVFSFLGILLNVGTMVAIIACRSLRKTQNIFTFNIALGDTISSIVLVLFTWPNLRLTSYPVVRTLGSMQEAAWMVGICSTLAVAIHRFIIIRLDPFQNRRIVSTIRCVIACVIMWVVTLTFNLSYFVHNDSRLFEVVFPITLLCGIGVTGICYIVVYITISKPPGDIGLSSDAYLLRVRRNKKVLCTFLLVVCSNLICWAPLFFSGICLFFRPPFMLAYNPQFDRYLAATWFRNLIYIGYLLVSTNSIINPVLYWTRLSDFRRLLCSCCGRRNLKDSTLIAKDSKIENVMSVEVAKVVDQGVASNKENRSV